jgi:hypothetical protein
LKSKIFFFATEELGENFEKFSRGWERGNRCVRGAS